MKHRSLYFIILFLPVLFNSNITRAQSNEVDFQTWSDFTYTYTIKNRNNIGADIGARGLVSKNEWNQFYFRPTYKYYFNEVIQVAGGVAVFSTISEVLENTNEIRIFEEFTLHWPSTEYVHFFHRFRLEQRFFHYQAQPQLLLNFQNDFETRLRYQISLETMDIRLGNSKRPIYILGAWEFFYSLDDAVLEQFINNQRILGGLGHRITPRFKYEIQYIFQRSRKFVEDGLKTTEHLARLRIYLQIN